MAKTDSIVLGGGCFWCLEAIFQRVIGIVSVTNGYAGGTVENPSYEAVCSGETGHAEVVKLAFDPATASLKTILQIFWTLHDPTTRNRQGNDVGTQYRSVIFYENQEQKTTAEESLKQDGQPLWNNPIVTEIKPLEIFYPAEDYHQDYFNNHPEQAYCQTVINPKIAKLKQKFSDQLKY